MTGFHVQPDALARHAGAAEAVGQDVGSAAAAEVTGTGQADFGILIGHTLGYGIRAIADNAEHALRATSAALTATADGLRSTADTYRGAETDSRDGIRATGGEQ